VRDVSLEGVQPQIALCCSCCCCPSPSHPTLGTPACPQCWDMLTISHCHLQASIEHFAANLGTTPWWNVVQVRELEDVGGWDVLCSQRHALWLDFALHIQTQNVAQHVHNTTPQACLGHSETHAFELRLTACTCSVLQPPPPPGAMWCLR
jgi:hypothetical protein